MTAKNFLILVGTLLSIVLLVIVFKDLDWHAFFTTLKTVQLPVLFLAAIIIALNVALRSLRWLLVTRLPLGKYKYFWQAASIGYLGNIIYPMRAGEVLRIVAIHHFVPLELGRAVTSSVIDRILDMIIVGIFTILVFWIHGHRIDPNIGRGIIGVFIIATVILILLTVFADYLYTLIKRYMGHEEWQCLLQTWLLHALEGIQAFRHTSNVLVVLLLTVIIFLLDYIWMWQIIVGFGWDLPFEAGLTVGVFILLGVSLPSAPGYIGIYQAACVLALGLYGIDKTSAVAYSIVLQLINFAVIGIQGMIVITLYSFNLTKERQTDLSDISLQ